MGRKREGKGRGQRGEEKERVVNVVFFFLVYNIQNRLIEAKAKAKKGKRQAKEKEQESEKQSKAKLSRAKQSKTAVIYSILFPPSVLSPRVPPIFLFFFLCRRSAGPLYSLDPRLSLPST